MNILTLNTGSSSIKCALFCGERLLDEARLEWKNTSRNSSRAKALEQLVTQLASKVPRLDAIGHRIVHGGEKYKESTLISDEVKKSIQKFAEFSPLHNYAELENIEILESLFKTTPQIAVFDTSFHRSLPPETLVYPGPYKWLEEGIQRYGFHGINYQYCARRAIERLGPGLKMVICHLGSGASLCAIKEGKSYDTTMGFTPLEGLMMDTRSGTLDPGILLYLLKSRTPQELEHELYHQSGLLGLSGISSDMRDILAKCRENNPRAQLALEVYVHRLNALIGSMIASLEGLDVLVFTAGIGENAPLIRKRTCSTFSFLGLKLDEAKNEAPPKGDCLLSTNDSKIKVLLIPAQEAQEIARECLKQITGL